MYIFGYHILVFALWGASFAVCAFGLWKGDAAVRWAALVHLTTYFVEFFVNPWLGELGAASLTLAAGLGSAMIYLLLAIRFANLWIGGVMLLQSAEFALDAYYLVTERSPDRLHAWIHNTSEWGVIVCILVGTVLAIRRRLALAREAAELEALRQQRLQGRPAR